MKEHSLCRGLPPDICAQLRMEEQVIKIRLEKRKFGKEVTVIEGISEAEFDLEEIASKLKSKLAVGGTVKNGRIELQGDQRNKVKKLLIEMGFPEENITVIY